MARSRFSRSLVAQPPTRREWNREIKPAPGGPDAGYVRAPFPIRGPGREVLRDENWCDGPGMFAVGHGPETALLPCDQPVLAPQPRRAMPTDAVPLIDQITMHPLAATDPTRERKGRADMREMDQIRALSRTGRPIPPGKIAALAHAGGPAHAGDRKLRLLRPREGKAHRLASLAKKAAAFFKMSRACLSTAFSRRSRLNPARRSRSASSPPPSSRPLPIQPVSNESPTIRSSATSRRVRPRVSVRPTASGRNPGVTFRPGEMENLLPPQLILSSSQRQVYTAAGDALGTAPPAQELTMRCLVTEPFSSD